MNAMRPLLGGLLFVAASASARDAEDSSLRIPLDQFRAEVKTLCALPLTSEMHPPEWHARRAWIEQFLAGELTRAGFEVVPAEKLSTLEKALLEEVGGTTDPLTGLRDRAKLATFRDTSRRRAVEQHGCDAFADAAIEYGTTSFMDAHAVWDHVDHNLGKSWGMYGWLGALTFHLTITAADGRVLYERWAGMHTLATWRNKRFEDLSDAEILANRAWNARAVLVALGEFTQPVGEDLVECLREQFRATRSKPSGVGRTVGSRYLRNWAVEDRLGIEGRGACEAARFAFVPPPADTEATEEDEPAHSVSRSGEATAEPPQPSGERGEPATENGS